MNNKGKGPLSIMIIVLLVLLASLAALLLYSKLSADDDPYNIGNGVIGVSGSDGKVGIYDKDGNFTELPENVVVPGSSSMQMGLIAETLKQNQEKLVSNDNNPNQGTTDPVVTEPVVTEPVVTEPVKPTDEPVDITGTPDITDPDDPEDPDGIDN